MQKSQLISFLNEIGAAPRKSLSQNFLIDSQIISKLTNLAKIEPGDWVLEIGPGAGAITEKLLSLNTHVYAIEKDPLFAKHLLRMQTPDERLKVCSDDFLNFPLGSLRSLSEKWKVVSNIPYQITAPILETLCQHAKLFESATLILQKEVGDRLLADPYTKMIGSLTIFVQFYAEIVGSFPISSNCFYPKPSVESMAIKLRFKETLPAVDPKLFFSIVRTAFQQRRKMLTTSLKTDYPMLGAILSSIGLSNKARPEEMNFDEWIALTKALSKTV